MIGEIIDDSCEYLFRFAIFVPKKVGVSHLRQREKPPEIILILFDDQVVGF
jgi:hypothetical protein